jgi:hypothetical protein
LEKIGIKEMQRNKSFLTSPLNKHNDHDTVGISQVKLKRNAPTTLAFYKKKYSSFFIVVIFVDSLLIGSFSTVAILNSSLQDVYFNISLNFVVTNHRYLSIRPRQELTLTRMHMIYQVAVEENAAREWAGKR